jgi:hypothetical protein
MIRATLPTLAALAMLALSHPVRAQTGNQSDNSGPNVTGSGPMGGSFLGAGLRSENEMFGRYADDVVFRNARIGCAMRTAERMYVDSIEKMPRTPAELRVLALLDVAGARAAGDASPVDAVTLALAHGQAPGSPLGVAARRLAVALDGLMRQREGCPDSRAGYEEAPQWQEAIRAFKAYVHDTPDLAFSPPAPEIVAIHAAMQSVVAYTLRVRDAR